MIRKEQRLYLITQLETQLFHALFTHESFRESRRHQRIHALLFERRVPGFKACSSASAPTVDCRMCQPFVLFICISQGRLLRLTWLPMCNRTRELLVVRCQLCPAWLCPETTSLLPVPDTVSLKARRSYFKFLKPNRGREVSK